MAQHCIHGSSFKNAYFRGRFMKNSLFLSAAFSLLALGFLPGTASADACPEGTITNPTGAGGQPQCVPGVNHQNWGGSQNSGPSYSRRWGAFASDVETSKVGLSTGMTSKRKAEKAALEQCRSKGGLQCKPLFSYYDQCGAIAWGRNAAGEGGGLIWARAGRKEEAAAIAMQECGKDSSTCKIFFAECSYGQLAN